MGFRRCGPNVEFRKMPMTPRVPLSQPPTTFLQLQTSNHQLPKKATPCKAAFYKNKSNSFAETFLQFHNPHYFAAWQAQSVIAGCPGADVYRQVGGEDAAIDNHSLHVIDHQFAALQRCVGVRDADVAICRHWRYSYAAVAFGAAHDGDVAESLVAVWFGDAEAVVVDAFIRFSSSQLYSCVMLPPLVRPISLKSLPSLLLVTVA